MYSSVFVIVATLVLSAMGNGSYGGLPASSSGNGAPQGSYNNQPPPQGSYNNNPPPPQSGGYDNPPPPQSGGYDNPPPPQSGGYDNPPPPQQPQYGSQPSGNDGYDSTGLPPMDYGKEDPPFDPVPCEQDQSARIENPTCSLQQSCQLGGFCPNQRFGLFNPKRNSCMTVECYISTLTKFTNLFRKNKKDPKLRLVTKKCSLGMSFRPTGEHTFGWNTCAGQGQHLNLVHYPKEGGQLCARRRKFATFFYPCDNHSTRYTLGALSRKGSFQIQAQSVSGLRSPACLTAAGMIGSKVSTQKCGGMFCYKEQQWVKVNVK